MDSNLYWTTCKGKRKDIEDVSPSRICLFLTETFGRHILYERWN